MAIIISASAGVGKTELARRYRNVLDLDCSAYSKSPDWPDNYIDAIKENADKYDYILIFTKLQNLKKLDYEFFFPAREAVPEYEERLAARGGKWTEWSKTVYARYDVHLYVALMLGKRVTFLRKGETLESFLLQNEGEYPKLIANV